MSDLPPPFKVYEVEHRERLLRDVFGDWLSGRQITAERWLTFQPETFEYQLGFDDGTIVEYSVPTAKGLLGEVFYRFERPFGPYGHPVTLWQSMTESGIYLDDRQLQSYYHRVLNLDGTVYGSRS